ncbi:aldo/keto reductase [Acetoanaerobium sticklandii]|uniref:aldo/keto reductase n=1 Tax=Acetoanaerobium sticklandii TaxID=1511 RepID=UPI003A8F3756
MKLALGTAQFGLNYGIANKSGKVSDSNLHSILSHAKLNNILKIDTAWAYGDSEERLGKSNLIDDFKVVTKVPLEIISTGLSVKHYVNESLSRLGVDKVFSVMFHNPQIVLHENGSNYFKELHDLKKQGLVEKVGVSVYTLDELEKILENYSIDIVQIPMSPFDQEFLSTLKVLKKLNIEVHIRSIFLQGLYFLPTGELDTFFNPVIDKINNYIKTKNTMGITTQDFVLGFFKQHQDYIDNILIAVDNIEQLNDNINFFNSIKDIDIDYSVFDFKDNKYRKPNNWELN